MKLKLHTKGIKGSSIVPAGEEPSVLFGVVVEIDDEISLNVHSVRLSFAEEITQAVIELHPSGVEVIAHDEESWEAFNGRYQNTWKTATARTGMGQLIAKEKPES